MSRLKYRRPELSLYQDPVVGGCASDQVSAAECSCDCVAGECELVQTLIWNCDTDSSPCQSCADGSNCA